MPYYYFYIIFVESENESHQSERRSNVIVEEHLHTRESDEKSSVESHHSHYRGEYSTYVG